MTWYWPYAVISFDYLREPFCRCALRVLAIDSFRKKKAIKNVVFLRKSLTIIDLFRKPVVGGDTFSLLATVLLTGPE